MDCHMMVTDPKDYIDSFAKAGASSFTFHLETAYREIQAHFSYLIWIETIL